jgi:hypothetical protein
MKLRRAAEYAAIGIVLPAGLGVGTYPAWRRWCLTWGATQDEATGTLPGDELLEEASTVTTRAVSVEAPPEAVWPWLVQMGPGRAGAYTYDWIENLFGLNMHSADAILPEFQDLKVGDEMPLGKSGPRMRVEILDRDHALVMRSTDGNWVWAFILVPDGEGSRLISRNRFKLPGTGAATRLTYKYFMEPGSLVMERKMLLGIKERAERPAAPVLVAV